MELLRQIETVDLKEKLADFMALRRDLQQRTDEWENPNTSGLSRSDAVLD